MMPSYLFNLFCFLFTTSFWRIQLCILTYFLYIRLLLRATNIWNQLVELLFLLCCSYCMWLLLSLLLLGIELGDSSMLDKHLSVPDPLPELNGCLFLGHTCSPLSLEPWHSTIYFHSFLWHYKLSVQHFKFDICMLAFVISFLI